MKTLMMAAALIVLGSSALKAQQARQLGAGVILGSPTGLTAKYYLTDVHALDAGVGEIGGDLAVYGDYLWHAWATDPKIQGGKLGFYLGLGGRMRDADTDDVLVGVRTVGGALFRFSSTPVEVFAEVAPVFEVAPDQFVNVDGGVGVRYFFAGGK